MANPYRDLLTVPGAKGFTFAALVMRMPMSMVSIGIVLLVSALRGSYALAGALSATYALVGAAGQPLVARLVDRRGQGAVMVPVVVAHAVGLSGLIAATVAGAPTAVLFATAALAGGTFVPVGSLVRARWSHALGSSPLLQAAYSFESVLDEVVFIIGPVLVTLLATSVSPAAGLLAALALLVVGTVALAPQRATEPPPSRLRAELPGPSAIRQPGIRVLAVVFAGVGAVFGSVEVTTVAFAAERGRPSAAAWVLALFALGSLLSGVVYGMVRWRVSRRRRFLVSLVSLASAVAVFPLIDAIALLAVVAFLAGFAISPTIIAGYALVEELVVASALTEGLTWTSTGIGVGLAIGSSVVGQVIDTAGARSAFVVSLAAGAVAVASALAGARWLLPAPVAARPEMETVV